MREDLEEVFSAPIGTFRVQLFFFTRRREEVKLHKECDVNPHFQSAVVFFHTKAQKEEVAQREN
jgi:hypothetical protein